MRSFAIIAEILIGVVIFAASNSMADPKPQTKPPAGGRHALLVGCTTYKSLPDGMQLEGPANDVIRMRELLIKHFHYSNENIRTLAEAEPLMTNRPTLANIEREIKNLIDAAKAGDQIVILLAGHGSQEPNDNPEQDPELDGLDEIFLPSDIGAWNGAKGEVKNAIRDDKIGHWLDEIRNKGAFVFFIADCCHSGTLMRGTDDVRVREVSTYKLGIPVAALEEARRNVRGEITRGNIVKPAVDLPQNASGIVAIYASQSSEPTVERLMPPDAEKRQYYGLLTYTLCQTIESAKRPITYRELLRSIHWRYQGSGPSSPTPMLDGTNLDQEILGQKEWVGRSQVLLKQNAEKVLTITAGGVHGITSGTILAVYPRADAEQPEKLFGHVRVTGLGAIESRVVPVAYEEAPVKEDLPIDGRCEVVFRGYPKFRLNVSVDSKDIDNKLISAAVTETVTATLKSIEAKPGALIKIATQQENTDWLVRVGGNNVYLVPAGGFLSREPTTAPPPLFGPAPINEKLADWIEGQMKRIARVQNLRSVADPESGTTINAGDVSLELKVLRKTPDGKAETVNSINGRTVKVDDTVWLEVTNRTQAAVDVTVLFIDGDYGIQAVFPREAFDDNRLQKIGDTLKTPTGTVTASSVPEQFLIIAVRTKPQNGKVSFEWLAQQSLERAAKIRGMHGPKSPLEHLLETGAFGNEGKAAGKTTTRGFKSNQLGEHTIQTLSWTVQSSK